MQFIKGRGLVGEVAGQEKYEEQITKGMQEMAMTESQLLEEKNEAVVECMECGHVGSHCNSCVKSE